MICASRVPPAVQAKTTRARVVARADAGKASFAAAAAALVLLNATPAFASLESDLLAKTQANKELNDKKRLYTSYANFARSRTVTDGTCKFPFNFLGCENEAEFGRGVKFITDDLKLECQGQDVCTSKPRVAGPSFMGV